MTTICHDKIMIPKWDQNDTLNDTLNEPLNSIGALCFSFLCVCITVYWIFIEVFVLVVEPLNEPINEPIWHFKWHQWPFNDTINDPLNDSHNQKRALIFLKEVGAIDNSSFRQINGVDTLKASADLRDLRSKSILDQKGKGKATYYVGGSNFVRTPAEGFEKNLSVLNQ